MRLEMWTTMVSACATTTSIWRVSISATSLSVTNLKHRVASRLAHATQTPSERNCNKLDTCVRKQGNSRPWHLLKGCYLCKNHVRQASMLSQQCQKGLPIGQKTLDDTRATKAKTPYKEHMPGYSHQLEVRSSILDPCRATPSATQNEHKCENMSHTHVQTAITKCPG